ncbi:MAG: hypothetical protein WBL63_21660 [Candidatus Acidiferrum sp.]
MLPKPFHKHLFPALLAGLSLRLFFIWKFPFASGDTPCYEELARNWLHYGVYGLFSNGHLYPTDVRLPGYPGFLAVIYSLAGPGRNAVFLAQAFVDLATCILVVCIAARLAAGANETTRSRITIAALWLAVLCPFTANYAAVPLTEVPTIFLTTLAILIFLLPSAHQLDLIRERVDILRAVWTWFLGGLVVGLGTLFRPETPLLLVAVLPMYWLRGWRPVNWEKLTLATLWVIAGVLMPLAPWAARNAHTLGRVQFLAPRYAESFGEAVPTGFYAWTQTWMFRSRDAYLSSWKLPIEPISLDDLPAYAFDSPEERSRVAFLLERYNRERGMSAQVDLEFTNLAQERTRRHPLRSYVWIPIERTAAMWFTPRTALLPFSGQLWPRSDGWHEGPKGFAITLGLALLNFLYAGLAILGVMRWRESPGIALIVAFIVIRTAFLTQMQTCEPRYVLVCFPALLALGAQSWGIPPGDAFRIAALKQLFRKASRPLQSPPWPAHPRT